MNAIQDFWDGSHVGVGGHYGDPRENGRLHRGTDYAHPLGSAVPSPLNGVVVGKLAPATWHGFGYQVTLRVASGETYSFAHFNSESPLSVGQEVGVGQTIGYVGRTGATTGPCVHVEYNLGGFSDSAPHIAALVNGSTAPAGAGTVGDAGVADGQRLLNSVGYHLAVDGINGPATKDAVRDYQSKHGLVVDGILGPDTAASIRATATPAPAPAPAGGSNANGAALAAVQRKLRTSYPAYAGKLVIDGIDGPVTRAAISEFQRRHGGLVVDGIAGPATRAALGL